MFKKRERPNSASSRKKDDDEKNDGESGAVPISDKKKVRSANSGAEGIGASTKKGEEYEAAVQQKGLDDTAISGFKANEAKGNTPKDDATRLLTIDTEVGKDTRSMHERNLELQKGIKEGTLEKGIYRGQGAYKAYAEKSEGALSASKYSGLLGPVRGMSNVRSTMRVEYWNASSGTDGGICKDYKETGYCGYGDSCKYLHDRSDYKQGYELEAEWEAKQKAIETKKRERWEKRMQKRADAAGVLPEGDSESSSSESEDEALPQMCPVCKDKWEECKSIPIQTVCGHYFCEDCAMEHFSRSPKCMTCDQPTNGIFNSVDALEQKLKKKKEDKKRKKEAKKGNIDPFNKSLED